MLSIFLAINSLRNFKSLLSMLFASDLFPGDMNWDNYLKDINIPKIINFKDKQSSINLQQKIVHDPNFSVDPNNKIPFPPEFDDLTRLHYLVCSKSYNCT